ncbi:MAG: hypothetical protein E5X49_26430, partial [Mesorhizobium sp.]
LLSLQRAKSVTHLSGMNCHPSLGKDTKQIQTFSKSPTWQFDRFSCRACCNSLPRISGLFQALSATPCDMVATWETGICSPG